LLGYRAAEGYPPLRQAVAEMLKSTRGIAAEASQILIVRGSQMALDLCARALVHKGDAVAVEALGYPPAWACLRAAGARLVPISVDADGLSVEALMRAHRRRRLRALVVTPHHQYPTTVSLSAPRRAELLSFCAANRIAVLEDDYDHELSYESKPLLPLASIDAAGVVVYIGTLSKIVAPGLRLGFVCAPPEVVNALASVRAHTDRQGDGVLEAAIADLLEDGSIARHARRLRRAGHERRDTLVAALKTHLRDVLEFAVPHGGMAVWGRCVGVDADAWAARALEKRVTFATAARFALDGQPRPFVRLGFAALTPDEIKEAVRRMASAL
jgi:GntR family transcriptional regulator/MocR family aminotransferase